jgi:hypothetical protein
MDFKSALFIYLALVIALLLAILVIFLLNKIGKT